jgi:hypothetical protein
MCEYAQLAYVAFTVPQCIGSIYCLKKAVGGPAKLRPQIASSLLMSDSLSRVHLERVKH